MAEALAYRIRHWGNGMFELKAANGRSSSMPWVAVPTKHDGKGFLRLMGRDHTGAAYGCWVLLLAVAAKCPVRGLLADEDGPLSVEDIALKTHASPESMRLALEHLLSPEIGWIEQVAINRAQLERSTRSIGAPTDVTVRTDGTDGTYRPLRAESDAGETLEGSPGMSAQVRSAFGGLSPGRLNDIKALRSWLHWQHAELEQPLLDAKNPESLVRVVAVASEALKRGKNPVALFASMIGKNRAVSQSAMNAARKRLEGIDAEKRF